MSNPSISSPPSLMEEAERAASDDLHLQQTCSSCRPGW